MQISKSIRKRFRRRLIGIAPHGLICSIGVALLSESVIAIPSSTGVQIAQQPVNKEQKADPVAAQKAFEEGIKSYQQGDKESLEQAIRKWEVALKLWKQVGDRRAEATTLDNIGLVYFDSGDKEKALKSFDDALAIRREVGDRRGEATTLTNIGAVYAELGENQQALTFFNQALPIRRAIGDRPSEATTLSNIGEVYSDLGDNQKALTFFNQALLLRRVAGDRPREANLLSNIAYIDRKQGNLLAALTNIKKAIDIIEDLRIKMVKPEERRSFFATKQSDYKFKINLLMQLHEQNPSIGYNIQAWETTERSHARSLLEFFTETKANGKQKIQPYLLKREFVLNQQQDILENKRQELAKNQNSDRKLSDLKKKIAKLHEEERKLRTEIWQKSPIYAALNFSVPTIELPQIQQNLDDDTVLLTYSLGDERSYLWLVSKDKIQSYKLPKRSIIEAQAKQFYKQQKEKPSETNRDKKVGIDLSQMLLQPVANELDNKRLLILGDGVLEYIPFAALPGCKDGTCNDSLPLVSDHEIVHAPSASILNFLQQNQQRRKPTKTLAIIANPAFGKVYELEQLPNTKIEAEAIMELVPEADRTVKLGHYANREFATSPELGEYQHILFATHGIFDSQDPDSPKLALAMVDKKDNPQKGWLMLNDVVNLKLSADLVVLSACETGLGRQINGEGLVGFTSGFMYAGSPRVVVSLWKVSDASTPILMKEFYTEIFKGGLTPAAALRSAQLKMLKHKDYSDPYYWAGFTLQGEWKKSDLVNR
jgi:CHAT domain-containing protein/Tfp pilus assembly protein PilF